MSERTVKHSTIVVERNFKGAPARVFAPWAELDVHRRWNVPGNDWKSQSMKIPFELGWGATICYFEETTDAPPRRSP
jgi:uncharacterized protein YndB with AHSA1/START domain